MLLEGGPTLAGSFLDAGEVDELRLFIAPIVLGGAGRQAAGRGRGRRPDRRRHAGAGDGLGALGRRPAGPRPPAGVVAGAMFTGHRSRDRNRRGASSGATQAPACASGRARGGAGRGRLGVGERRLPDGGVRVGRRLRGRRDEPDAVADHPWWARGRRFGQPRAAAAGRGAARRSPRPGTRGRHRRGAGRSARTGSPGGCGSRRRASSTASSSSAARSPSTASASRWPPSPRTASRSR